MAVVEFECRSGIAGNLWMAALIGLGADRALAEGLPRRVGLPYVRLKAHLEHNGEARAWISLEGTSDAPAARYEDMLERIRRASLPVEVRATALQVLQRRQETESRVRGVKLRDRMFAGDAMADTLIDVVGGVLMWFELGKPAITTRGPVVLGGRRPPAVPALLGAVPTEIGPPDLELTTPTGAALLGFFWQAKPPAGPLKRRVTVPGDFSSADLRDELRASLFR